MNFKKKETEEQVEFTDVLKPEATVVTLSSQTNTGFNTKMKEKPKESEEKVEKDKLDTQALQQKNQGVTGNKNQKLSRRIKELIKSEEDKAWKDDSSSEQQEEMEKLQENPETTDPEAQLVNLVSNAAFVEPEKKITKISGGVTNGVEKSKVDK